MHVRYSTFSNKGYRGNMFNDPAISLCPLEGAVSAIPISLFLFIATLRTMARGSSLMAIETLYGSVSI